VLAKGDATAMADLDRLAEEIIRARRAGQDAEITAQAARDSVAPLRKSRESAERSELAAHLAPLLDVQTALASQVDAAIGLLATTIGLYRAACHEAGAIAALLGIPAGSDTDQLAASRVAKRLMVVLYSTLSSELRYVVTSRQALADFDRERTAAAREAVEKLQTPAPGAASA
jgi:hypothetical protein